LRKSVAQDDARAALGKILIDDFDLRLGPAQLDGSLAQLVLPVGRFAIEYLRGGGLANVNVMSQMRFERLSLMIFMGYGKVEDFTSLRRVRQMADQPPAAEA
jgi:hypothetical protein